MYKKTKFFVKFDTVYYFGEKLNLLKVFNELFR